MTFKTSIRAVAVFAFVALSFVLHAQNNAADILKKMDQTTTAIKDKSVTIKMVILNIKTKKTETKEAELLQKGTNRKLFRYTAPPSDAGIATLSLPNNEIYVYLPMFKKPKKITNIAESGVFNQSDFSLEDMATQSYSEKYIPKLLGTSDTAYQVDLLPKDPKSPYSHVVVFVDKKNFYAEQFVYYDSKKTAIKKAVYHYTKVAGLWVADVVSMEDLKKSHKTTLYMSNIKVNQGLSDDLFTLEKLVPAKK